MPVSESWGPFQPPSGLLPLVRAEEPHQLVQMESDKHTPMPAQEDAQGGSGSSLTRSKHSHWCTSRQHRGEIKSCAGFKRHEKEDEEYYVFLPLGPIVPGPQGSPKCALCDELHPDDAHLEEHNVLMYKEKKAPIRKARRPNFEKLLESHGVSGSAIKVLTQKWYHVDTKRSYSCGLCISFFPSRHERTNHYENEQFLKHQNLKDWDDNNIIKGHLLRPELHKECKEAWGIDPCQKQSGVSWNSSVVDGLLERLQLGQESPSSLVSKAKDTCTYADFFQGPTPVTHAPAMSITHSRLSFVPSMNSPLSSRRPAAPSSISTSSRFSVGMSRVSSSVTNKSKVSVSSIRFSPFTNRASEIPAFDGPGTSAAPAEDIFGRDFFGPEHLVDIDFDWFTSTLGPYAWTGQGIPQLPPVPDSVANGQASSSHSNKRKYADSDAFGINQEKVPSL